MPLRIGWTHREVRLGLQSKYAGTQQLTCTKQHVLLESLDVDFDKISLGDHPFGQQAIQSPHWHHPDLLRRLHLKSAGSLPIHGARSRIGRIEVEGPLAVCIAEGHAVIVPIGAAAVLFDQLLHNLLDGIEPVHNEMIIQRAPTDVFPTLHADVDQYEGFREQSGTHHPLCEFGLAVEPEIHFAGRFPVGDQRGPPSRTKQLHSGWVPSNLPERITEVEGNGSWSSDSGALSPTQAAGSP